MKNKNNLLIKNFAENLEKDIVQECYAIEKKIISKIIGVLTGLLDTRKNISLTNCEIALALKAMGFSYNCAPEDYENEKESQVKQYKAAKCFEHAIKYYEKALKDHPEYPMIPHNIANMSALLCDIIGSSLKNEECAAVAEHYDIQLLEYYGQAIKLYSKCLKENSEDLILCENMANVYDNLGCHTKAIKLYKKCLDQNSANAKKIMFCQKIIDICLLHTLNDFQTSEEYYKIKQGLEQKEEDKKRKAAKNKQKKLKKKGKKCNCKL